ncbi:T9SS type A sorting domain-containing protein [Flavobacterium aquatile]|uniref:Secretion system C-terminal sorting domain-containing protein n=1 Tax=Flavobacterium aquatile LMG 4008 = ATCC 11947 TaxID=1453498 RepID=A0A095SXR9_9FLAO|nr:T9SS type A sorting domain-containing protein [Flavobacterium aquatile]KGD69372.1 hypothetical protein LG45_00935 [Flavobacterium aquatile LMG 4008 = ATCC 11947]OXA66173.1 T9SS C-terminal target domain-containing protein [Flavobacterium aquatile LMG 4008 = ATCC 11947]GEC77664.1 hypothetical protein FAQ01_05340 [Flavobacterium aquatile]
MKNTSIFFHLTVLFLSLISSAQVTRKYNVFNDFVSNADFAPIIDTYDGGHLLQYSYDSSNGRDDSTVLIKTDANFAPIWKKSFGGYLNNKRVLTFPDGSSVLFARAGCFYAQLSPSPSSVKWYCPRFVLHKLNDQGQTIWSKEIGSVANNDFITPFDAFLKNANTIKIGGRKGPPTQFPVPVIMNFDLDGNLLNGTILQGLGGTVYSMSKEESTGNYFALIWNQICKFNQNDILLWAREIQFQSTSTFLADSVNAPNTKILSNGDLLVSCILEYANNFGRLLLRIDTNGNLVWAKKIACDYIGGIKELASGEIVVSIIDQTYYTDNVRLNYVLKITANGNLIWAKGYRNSTSASELYEKNANEWYFAVNGFDQNWINIDNDQPTIFSTDSSGNSACNGFDANITMTNENITLSVPTIAITQTPLLTPQSIPDTTTYLITLANLTSTTECLPLAISDFNSNDTYLYPNPSNGNFTIKSNSLVEKVEIFTLLGQKINEIMPLQLEFSTSIEHSGIYIVRIQTTYGNKMVKVIVTK